jgi:hypothetical protein
VPAARPDIVVLVPVPAVVTAPGVRINIQVPLDGKPLSTKLPVDIVQVVLLFLQRGLPELMVEQQ